MVLSALQLECGAGTQMGPIFPWPQEWNMLIMAFQGAEDGTWASFQTAG